MRFPSFVLAALWLAGSARGLSAQARIRLTLVDTAVLQARRLDESSGVVASGRPGIYWTHNDSGDGPFLYTTDSSGADLGRLRVVGAVNQDWEDLSGARCLGSAGTCLYVGDIGDNSRNRRHVTVYVVPEPDPPAGPTDTARTAPAIDSILLRYPDGPHDAEALAVTADGRLLIVTKDLMAPARLFAAPISGHARAPVLLEPVCTLAMTISAVRGRLATGAALSPDGRWLLVRTYASLHVFAMDGACTPLLPPNGVGIPVVETQGEGIAFDGPVLIVLTSEAGTTGHAIISRYRIEGLSP